MTSHIAAICDLWRTRRARIAVLAALMPFEESLRQIGREDPRSMDSPYLTGFLLAAVSGLARHACPSLGAEGVGAVQLDVCGALTGVPRTVLAERLLALSLSEDAEFFLGCSDAIAFHATMIAAGAEARITADPSSASQEAQALWEQVVERWRSGRDTH
jgi:hypothetical protein